MRLSSSLLAWLRCFEATARNKSFTKAAAELCVTQGAVSQQVKQLEAWVQCPLLLRHPRGLAVTADGQWLAAVVRESFQSIEGTLAQLRAKASPGPLALSCSPSFAMGWLTPRLGDFYRNHPDIGLRVISEFHALDRAGMTHDEVAAGLRFDLGQYKDLAVTEILDEWLVPVASPDFLRAHPELRSPSDLDASLLLHDGNAWVGAEPYEEWELWLRHVDLSMESLDQGHQFNLTQLAQAAAASGQGIAMGRLALVLDDLTSGRLVAPFGLPVRSRAAYHFVSAARPSAQVETVLAWLIEQKTRFTALRDEMLQRIALPV